MTRFARARGSKSSNEKEPESATPWAEMSKSIKINNESRIRNVEEIEEDQEEFEQEQQEINKFQKEEEGTEKNTKDRKNVTKISKKSDSNQDEKVEEIVGEESKNKSELSNRQKKKERNKDRCLNCKEKGHMKRDCPKLDEARRKELQELYVMKVERKGHGTGRKKNKKRDVASGIVQDDKSNFNKRKFENDSNEKKEFKDKAGQVVQEGEGTFQGFRVRKEDVKRLKKLAKELRVKKVPAEEMKEILKKERRRAENELQRSKKMVCYQCRQPGHFLSDCPEKEKEENQKRHQKSGHCFKCGSDQHSSKECKTKRTGEEAFRFAVCFICNETGHLAKACPDNPKGLYPKGGGCRFCGSVEHLKAECPRKSAKDAKDEMRLDVINEDNDMGIEGVREPVKKKQKKDSKNVATKKKVVKF